MSKFIGDKELVLERIEPLVWLKCISLFSNASSGLLLYGIKNDGGLVEGNFLTGGGVCLIADPFRA